ncbi:MAG TPA: UrcA family protein [Phenylobacterium sp.]
MITVSKIAGAAALCLAALPLVAIAGIAQAAPASVVIRDLDMSSAQGQAQFNSRVDRAAQQFCKDRVTGTRTTSVSCIAAVRAEMNDKLAQTQQATAQTSTLASR